MKADLLIDCQNDLGEAPVWDTHDRLIRWVDITRGVAYQAKETGIFESRSFEAPLAAVLPTGNGQLLAQGTGLELARGHAKPSKLLQSVADTQKFRWNELKVDPSGVLWGGVMRYDQAVDSGHYVRVDRKMNVTEHLKGWTIPNGIDWDLANGWMYVVETASRTIKVFEFDAAESRVGALARTLHLEHFSGYPDGMTLDISGNLWVAFWQGGAVRCLSPRGRLLDHVELPVELVTSCAFGGSSLATLFITTARYGLEPDHLQRQPHAGSLFSVLTGTSGVPSRRFEPETG